MCSSVSVISPLASSFALTSSTYPSSTSGFSSRILKILSAPASAITIELNCWLIWFTGIENDLLNVRKLTRAPMVNPPTPFNASIPPTIAQRT